jgi:hypothetical protein
MKKRGFFYLLIPIVSTLMASCSDQEKPTGATTVLSKKPVIMDPFRFHKMIEVSPGQDYDILSWGRGATDVGAFMILHSDSAARKYTTTTGDLDGSIVDVYNSDMDLDGNPEILIQIKSKDTVNYTNIYAFEFTNDKAQKLDFPKLTQSQRKGYRGNDNFFIKDGMLIREFPIYTGSGMKAKPTGAKRQFQYGLRNNSFTIKQLSKDSTSVSSLQPVATKPAKTTGTKKINTTIKKHKKKHIRRNSDEG